MAATAPLSEVCGRVRRALWSDPELCGQWLSVLLRSSADAPGSVSIALSHRHLVSMAEVVLPLMRQAADGEGWDGLQDEWRERLTERGEALLQPVRPRGARSAEYGEASSPAWASLSQHLPDKLDAGGEEEIETSPGVLELASAIAALEAHKEFWLYSQCAELMRERAVWRASAEEASSRNTKSLDWFTQARALAATCSSLARREGGDTEGSDAMGRTTSEQADVIVKHIMDGQASTLEVEGAVFALAVLVADLGAEQITAADQLTWQSASRMLSKCDFHQLDFVQTVESLGMGAPTARTRVLHDLCLAWPVEPESNDSLAQCLVALAARVARGCEEAETAKSLGFRPHPSGDLRAEGEVQFRKAESQIQKADKELQDILGTAPAGDGVSRFEDAESDLVRDMVRLAQLLPLPPPG